MSEKIKPGDMVTIREGAVCARRTGCGAAMCSAKKGGYAGYIGPWLVKDCGASQAEVFYASIGITMDVLIEDLSLVEKPEPRVVAWTGKTFPSGRDVRVRPKGNTDCGKLIVSWGPSGVTLRRHNDPCLCDAEDMFVGLTYDQLLGSYEETDGDPCGVVTSK